jgi:FKBP-type peptidyl-prolyl cis-trans isomerase SlyD
MQVEKNKVVTIEYTLKGDDGAVIDTSEGGKPLVYIHGTDTLVVGLEKALDGKGPGDAVQVTVSPEEGYGQNDPSLIRRVPTRKLRLPSEGGRGAAPPRFEVGMRVVAETPQGLRLVLIKSIQGGLRHR